jgi:hypothetical protein
MHPTPAVASRIVHVSLAHIAYDVLSKDSDAQEPAVHRPCVCGLVCAALCVCGLLLLTSSW